MLRHLIKWHFDKCRSAKYYLSLEETSSIRGRKSVKTFDQMTFWQIPMIKYCLSLAKTSSRRGKKKCQDISSNDILTNRNRQNIKCQWKNLIENSERKGSETFGQMAFWQIAIFKISTANETNFIENSERKDAKTFGQMTFWQMLISKIFSHLRKCL